MAGSRPTRQDIEKLREAVKLKWTESRLTRQDIEKLREAVKLKWTESRLTRQDIEKLRVAVNTFITPEYLLSFFLQSPDKNLYLEDLAKDGFPLYTGYLCRRMVNQGLLSAAIQDGRSAYSLPRAIALLVEFIENPGKVIKTSESTDRSLDIHAFHALRTRGLATGVIDRRDGILHFWLNERERIQGKPWYSTVTKALELLQKADTGGTSPDKRSRNTGTSEWAPERTTGKPESKKTGPETKTARERKNEKIAETFKKTRERRENQICKVYELKVDKSRLSKETRRHLKRLFIESKWFYNYIVSQNDPFNVDTKIKNVPVKVKDKFEERELRCLGSQMKQDFAKQVQSSIKSLATKKKKGEKVGKLKFKSRVNSIPLKQYGITYILLQNGKELPKEVNSPCRTISSNGRVKIQKVKQALRIRGLDQLPAGVELANAHLATRYDDYYLQLVTYQPKKPVSMPPNKSTGIDAGLAKQLTFSNGVAMEYRVPVTKKLRRFHKQLSRKQKGSKNREKTRLKLEKEYRKAFNIKKDIRNKTVSYLRQNYEIVCFQNENIRAWHRIWGSKVFDTSLGGLMSILKERMRTPVEVDRLFPSSQLCSNPECGHKQKIALDERTYICPECGLVIPRDVNSAINIEDEGLSKLGAVRAEVTPVEMRSSTLKMLGYFNSIPHVKASRIYEAGSRALPRK
ncbi:MAG: RNA-guided endonuclease InsQ/TnpB family protein [Candidatus Odinarchaeota archaeon]